MGNRGVLHDEKGRIVTDRWRHKNWISCSLQYKGIRRQLLQPNTYTELFFLDELTALAAGHRPCALCRRADYQSFIQAWQIAFGCQPSAKSIDSGLHSQRVAVINGIRKEQLAHDLPNGAMFQVDGHICTSGGRDAKVVPLWLWPLG